MSNQVDKMLEQIRLNFETLKTRWQQAMKQVDGNRLAGRSLSRLKTIPGKPHYPIRWTSERQRRAYFATNGFGRGIPSTRTGGIVGDWQAEFNQSDYGGILALVNMNPAAQYLQGDRAQGFHKDTGWVQLDDVTDDAYKEMGDVAVFTFYQIGDPFQGV